MLASVNDENKAALQFLLDRGHQPDIFPMVLVTRCMSPLMATLAKPNPWLEGFNLLAPHADLSLLTPVFRCHLLHFAVATLDLPLIQRVISTIGGPAAAQTVLSTALGHTLLHIASLPINDSVVNMHAQKIYSSIHEFRTTDEQWVPQRLVSTPPPTLAEMRTRGRGGRKPGRGGGTTFLRPHPPSPRFSDLSQPEHEAQAATLLYLLRSGSVPTRHLEKQDIHGNTVLHYLVSIRNPDYTLIQTIKEFASSPEDEDVQSWSSTRNFYGFTAEDCDVEGRAVKAEHRDSGHASFWNEDDDN